MSFFKSVKGVGFFGVLGNVFLLFLKMGIGFLFSSQAMIADGVNSFMDVFSSLMTLIGGKVSEKPRDFDHQFGHKKAEFLFSMFVSVGMMIGALMIFISSFQGLLHQHIVQFSYLLVVVCIITIFVKISLYFYAKSIFLNTKSLLVQSNMLDHRNDVLITLCTLGSIFFSFYGLHFLDSFVGMGIAGWIFLSGGKIFLESYHILMDHAITNEDETMIRQYIEQQEGVYGITKFETSPAGYQYLLILSILVDGNISTFESHKIADDLEKAILKKFPSILMVTIHVNPIEKTKKQA